ncbi:MAG: pyridoxal 5'-phosphate synthase glutaminase subunit PdxT [Prevotella sp.]|nr:pyridoxal 5'-phosphate synthase glutaminase subunit PdxT [Candidatus Prevotella equi]
MNIAILALQGAFAEHQQMLHRLGFESILIRNLNDWNCFINSDDKEKGLILPGGESTAMMKIMRDENMLEPLRNAISAGLPTFGTCAGMILLDKKHLGCMDITVLRNAYGRQLGSFYTEHIVEGVGTIPMTFIRAPYVEQSDDNVKVLSVLDNHIIAVQQNNMIACSFHPELNDDTSMHAYFIDIIKNHQKA